MKKIEVGFIDKTFRLFDGDYWLINSYDNSVDICVGKFDETENKNTEIKKISALQFPQVKYITFVD